MLPKRFRGSLADIEPARSLPAPSPSLRGRGEGAGDGSSDRALDEHLLGLGDRLGRVEALRADVRAVHDRVAAIEAERILELVEPLAGNLVAAVGEPAERLEKNRRAEEAIRIPPIARAGGRAAGAEDA